MAVEKIYKDEALGDVLFSKKKGIRRMSIRVHPVRGVRVTVPYLLPFSAAMAFFRLKREWIIKTVTEQQKRIKDLPKVSLEQVELMRRQAKTLLPPRLKELAERYGFKYNRVTIKHNVTNWGSCSTKGNINLNLNIVRLPDPLRDYILLHELCHLKHMNHSPAFHALEEKFCSDNLERLCEEGDPQAKLLLSAVVKSRAQYPTVFTCSRAMKSYPIL